MGGVKSQMLEDELLGIGGSVDKRVCKDHLNDYAIQNFISKTSKKGFCDYCNLEKKAVEVDKLMVFIMNGINRFYKDAAEFMPYDSAEGGYLGKTFDGVDLLFNVIELDVDNYELQDDTGSCIADKAWS